MSSKSNPKKVNNNLPIIHLNKLFILPMIVNNIGEDPKSILCAYFKAGLCEKGRKCKFSHDLALDGKAAKIDIYNDPRDKKGGPKDPSRVDQPCHDFIEAVECSLYGWLWECPNGGDKCKYMHALPAGYVLQDRTPVKDPNEEDDEDKLTIEE
jgi:hypothetical protein